MRDNTMISSLLVLTFILGMRISLCVSQATNGRKFEIRATVPLPSTDFKPLFTVDDSKDMFHRCFFLCERNQQCIGVQICKVKEDLFRCQACCEWKKVKKYTTQSGASNCTYYEQDVVYGANLAFKKNTTISSQYHHSSSPSIAVDGITTCPGNTCVASTGLTKDRWLSIHLGGTYHIKIVTIHARTDWHAYEADQTSVIVKDENSNSTYPCGVEYPGPTQVNDVIDFLCAAGTTGNNITIVKRHPPDHLLSVSEVEVFGNP